MNKLQGHGDPVLDVCFNHTESFLATGDAKVKILEIFSSISLLIIR